MHSGKKYGTFILWQGSQHPSKHCDWFFHGQDIAIRIVSVEKVIAYVFFYTIYKAKK